jgi:hypothetical protein
LVNLVKAVLGVSFVSFDPPPQTPCYWTTFLLLPALVLFCGLVAAQHWAWWIFRTASAPAALWFLGFVVIIPFADLRTEEGPVPWCGRLYMVGVTLVFAGIMTGAFLALGRPETRTYFGLVRREGNAVV